MMTVIPPLIEHDGEADTDVTSNAIYIEQPQHHKQQRGYNNQSHRSFKDHQNGLGQSGILAMGIFLFIFLKRHLGKFFCVVSIHGSFDYTFK